MGILYYTKFESSLGHKAIFNFIMPYFVIQIIISLEFSGDPENDQINLWPKRNPMTLNRIIMKSWNKWVIQFECQKSQQYGDVAKKSNRFEAGRVTTLSYRCCII